MIKVPQGRLKVVQDCVEAYFQPSLRDWSSFKCNPGLTSWAKFSRPFGTESGNEVLTHALKPSSYRPANEMINWSSGMACLTARGGTTGVTGSGVPFDSASSKA